MPRTRFVKSAEDIRRYQDVYATPSFLDIRTLAIGFLSDPDVVAELLPPPLRPAVEPRISISVSEIRQSDCVGPFNGSSVNIACTYDGRDGLYCLAMPMNTDTAVIFGRELFAEPKKLADIRLEQRGKHVRGTVTRHGITYIDLRGTFEDELAPVEQSGVSHHYYFKYLPAADGRGLAFDPQLVRVTHRGATRRVTRGAGTITFRESRHDPLIDIPVVQVLGATLSEGETDTTAEVVTTVPAALFMPYAYGKIDDFTAWADVGAPAAAQ